MQGLYKGIFYNEKVAKFYTDEALIRYMLQFESALAGAQAKHGIIPAAAAHVIAKCCRIEKINKEQLVTDAALGGNVVIPLVKKLTAVVQQKDKEAAKYVHLGATSQDVIDTALMLQVKDAFAILKNDLEQVVRQLVALIEEHRDTIMIGRSFMQQAKPITFGYKITGWLDPLLRSQQEIEGLLQTGFVLQVGGAVGTLSGMGEKGVAIAETMGDLLSLRNPAKSWHVERDYIVRIATTLGILTGNIGKVAKDISLMMQTEVSEVAEPSAEGKGSSSTMPHKRNPVGCVTILANAARVPGLVSTMLSCMLQDHERATGLWHAEWETLGSIVQLAAGCISKAAEVTNGLEVKRDQMQYNLEMTKGLIYAENVSLALADKIGKAAAHAMMEKWSREATSQGMHFKDFLLSQDEITKNLSPSEIEKLFNPAFSVGLSNEFITTVLAAYRRRSGTEQI